MTELGEGTGGPPPAGWYVDPQGQYRWWDGTRWTEHVAPGPATPAYSAPGPVAPGYAAPGSAATGYTAAGYAAADPFAAAPAGRSRRGGVIGLVVGALALLVVAVGAVVLLTRTGGSTDQAAPSSSPTASTSAPSSSATSSTLPAAVTSATQGIEVYRDDFTSKASGWPTDSLPSGTSFTYTKDGYVVVAKGELHHYAFAPYDKAIPQISVTATIRTDKAHPSDSGSGVMCDASTETDGVFYEFFVVPGEGWAIEQGSGVIGKKSTSSLLKKGETTVKAGDTMTVTGACTTSADGKTTVLTMFIDGAQVAQVTSTTPLLAGTDGWLADLVVTSYGTTVTTVTTPDFVVRDTAG